MTADGAVWGGVDPDQVLLHVNGPKVNRAKALMLSKQPGVT